MGGSIKLVTVGVPIYNAEAYLLECMYSIMRQSYTDIEIICVDDCTQDNSATVIKQLMKLDPRIKLITHKQNRGLGGARNTVIREARGEYILFVDADDGLAPDAVENLLHALEQSQAQVAMGAALSFYPDGYQSKESTFHYRKYVASQVKDLKTESDRYEIINMWPSAWAKLFRMSIIREHNLCFPEKLLYEDHWFYYSYFRYVSKFSYINQTVYYYRKARPGSITSFATGREEEIFKVIQGIEDRLKGLLSKEYYDRAVMRLSYRLLNERQYVLSDNSSVWCSYAKKSRKYLLERFDAHKLQDSIDTFEQETSDFYRFIFDPFFAIKFSLKEKLKEHRHIRNIVRKLKKLPPIQPKIPEVHIQRVEYMNDPVLSAISYNEELRLKQYNKIKKLQKEEAEKKKRMKQKQLMEKEMDEILSLYADYSKT